MKNTILVVTWLAKLANEIKEGIEDDGKLKWAELLQLTDNLLDLKEVVPAITKVHAELKAATPEQQQLVLTEVAKELDIDSDKAETVVLSSLDLGMAIIKLIEAIK